MDQVTLPCATVKQALEALGIGYESACVEAAQYHAAMAGYRPERHAAMDADVQTIAHAITALRAALAQQAEPVAWMYEGIKYDGTKHGPHLVWSPKYMDAMSIEKGAMATPLYTAPPAAKPGNPVAWRYQAQGRWIYVDKNANLWQDKPDGKVQALSIQQTTDCLPTSENGAKLIDTPDETDN